ncbi:hypothetical protein PGT21_010373 [Puccinia graminis f. sp. tritici]|uniref:Uncharacterized protein n=1 Tax=Puccinia graminis f. sp. tritici TaxID=56615 RepID=A0A5B0R0V1_PUCGR|nr:hypothetical protein PGT21_010373 [Puccinia graminis f. sp. tritici]
MKNELASVNTTVKRIDVMITQAGPAYAHLGKLYNSRADTEDSPAPDPDSRPERRSKRRTQSARGNT